MAVRVPALHFPKTIPRPHPHFSISTPGRRPCPNFFHLCRIRTFSHLCQIFSKSAPLPLHFFPAMSNTVKYLEFPTMETLRRHATNRFAPFSKAVDQRQRQPSSIIDQMMHQYPYLLELVFSFIKCDFIKLTVTHKHDYYADATPYRNCFRTYHDDSVSCDDNNCDSKVIMICNFPHGNGCEVNRVVPVCHSTIFLQETLAEIASSDGFDDSDFKTTIATLIGDFFESKDIDRGTTMQELKQFPFLCKAPRAIPGVTKFVNGEHWLPTPESISEMDMFEDDAAPFPYFRDRDMQLNHQHRDDNVIGSYARMLVLLEMMTECDLNGVLYDADQVGTLQRNVHGILGFKHFKRYGNDHRKLGRNNRFLYGAPPAHHCTWLFGSMSLDKWQAQDPHRTPSDFYKVAKHIRLGQFLNSNGPVTKFNKFIEWTHNIQPPHPTHTDNYRWHNKQPSSYVSVPQVDDILNLGGYELLHRFILPDIAFGFIPAGLNHMVSSRGTFFEPDAFAFFETFQPGNHMNGWTRLESMAYQDHVWFDTLHTDGVFPLRPRREIRRVIGNDPDHGYDSDEQPAPKHMPNYRINSAYNQYGVIKVRHLQDVIQEYL